MEETAYTINAALNPKTFIIDTVELRPFSLGGWIALDTVCSPFISPQEISISAEDGVVHYVTALLLCGQTWEDNEVLLNNDDLFNATIKELQEYLQENVICRPGWNLDTRILQLKHYLRYYIDSMPAFRELGTPSNPSGLDWKINVQTIFKTEFGYSESKILNMSLIQLWYEWCSFAEKGGAGQVITTREMKYREEGRIKAEEFRRKMKEQALQKELASAT